VLVAEHVWTMCFTPGSRLQSPRCQNRDCIENCDPKLRDPDRLSDENNVAWEEPTSKTSAAQAGTSFSGELTRGLTG
jgi:hypothetical protein